MRILQIGKFYPPYHYGGIETLSKTLHEGMRERGVDNDFLGFLPVSYKNDIAVDEHIYLCKTNIDKFSTQFSISFIKRWHKIKDSYDIIFISMPHPFANIVFNLFPVKKAKLVLWWHSDIIKQKFLLRFYKPFLIPFLKKIDAVIAPTNTHIDESDYAKYLIPKNTSSLIPIDRGKNNQEKKIIFACGRLIYYKGFHNLIDAAEFLPDCCVVRIAGEGALREKIEKQIKTKGLENKVFLLGRISDEQLDKELNDCFVLCLPSTHRTEMYALVQIDAFTHGKPVISTNIPRSGVPEVNIDGVTGFTVEVNNPKAIADKINMLLNDSNLYETFCQNARIRGKELTDKNIIERYIELFNKIIAPRGG